MVPLSPSLSFISDIIGEGGDRWKRLILAEHLDVIGLFNFARGESGKTRKKGRKIGAASVVVAAVATALSRRSFSKTAAEVAIKNVSWPLARPPARQSARTTPTII